MRHDGMTGSGGGVCVFIDCKLDYTVVGLPDEFKSLEIICVDVISVASKHRYICAYRPPSYNMESTELLIRCLDYLCNVAHAYTICTDFNMPNFNWNNNFDINAMCSLDACFANFIVSNGILQLITEPTRSFNTLDLLLVNDPLTTYDVTVEPPFSTSDHCMITWRTYFPVFKSMLKVCRYDFKRADYINLSQYLASINWHALFAQVPPTNINAVWSVFKNAILSAINLFVPKYEVKHSRKQPYYPLYVRRALKRKHSLWRIRHQYGMLEQYKSQASRCRRLIKNYHVRAEKRIINNKSTSAFYRHVNRKLDHCQRIPPIKAANGNILIKDRDKVEEFNEFFTSVFKHSDSLPCVDIVPDPKSMPIDFSVNAVRDALRRAKHNTSSGPDGIPSIFWASLYSVLAPPISIIFGLSYQLAVLPSEWKHALVMPLHKKGDASRVSNYRPISLTCTICKIMESMINSNLQQFLSDNDVISSSQHGFMPGRSTCTQLLESQLEWSMAIDNGFVTDVIFIDFSKAFDVVPHRKLISKLALLGVCSPTLNWGSLHF